MSAEQDKRKKWVKRAALLGFALSLSCGLLPEEYRVACQTLAQICTGGISP